MKQTKVFAFGTQNDPLAWEVADLLKPEFPGICFIKTDSPDDITSTNDARYDRHNERVIIIDPARGIRTPTLLAIDNLKGSHAVTSHDIDLGFTLKLLKQAGKISESCVRIIGIPMDSRPGVKVMKGVGRILRCILREFVGN